MKPPTEPTPSAGSHKRLGIQIIFEQMKLPDGTTVAARFPHLVQRWAGQAALPQEIKAGLRLSLEELEPNPERGLDVLRYCVYRSFLENLHNPPAIKASIKLQADWIEARRPLTKKAAMWLLDEVKDIVNAVKILHWTGTRGHPVTLTKAAIMGLTRQHYLKKPWNEVTKRVCPCGLEHSVNRVLTQCHPRLEAEVTNLRRVLRQCEITLPEPPTILTPHSRQRI